MKSRNQAFTLIELLIVVLIIAILAAIAVPNFLEFQTRAKVSRAKSDMRSMSIAVQAYYVDNNALPINVFLPAPNYETTLIPLSTPIGYLSNSFLQDPFADASEGFTSYYFFSLDRKDPLVGTLLIPVVGPAQTESIVNQQFALISRGPDRISEFNKSAASGGPAAAAFSMANLFLGGSGIYDPTNGTTSEGDVVLTGAGFFND